MTTWKAVFRVEDAPGFLAFALRFRVVGTLRPDGLVELQCSRVAARSLREAWLRGDRG
jgi:hypothetical protein